MIASTVKLFCCHSEHKEVKDMFRQLQPYHPTHVVEKDDCLHSFIVAKDPCHIFYDAWIESDVVQTKFIKTYKPEKITVPAHAKIFSYDKLYEVANYVQMLTGCKVNFREHGVEYKKNVVDHETVNKMYKEYLEELKWESI